MNKKSLVRDVAATLGLLFLISLPFIILAFVSVMPLELQIPISNVVILLLGFTLMSWFLGGSSGKVKAIMFTITDLIFSLYIFLLMSINIRHYIPNLDNELFVIIISSYLLLKLFNGLLIVFAKRNRRAYLKDKDLRLKSAEKTGSMIAFGRGVQGLVLLVVRVFCLLALRTPYINFIVNSFAKNILGSQTALVVSTDMVSQVYNAIILSLAIDAMIGALKRVAVLWKKIPSQREEERMLKEQIAKENTELPKENVITEQSTALDVEPDVTQVE